MMAILIDNERYWWIMSDIDEQIGSCPILVKRWINELFRPDEQARSVRSNISAKKPKIIMQPRKKAQSPGQTLYCNREIATRALLARSAAVSRLFFIASLSLSVFPCLSWTRFYCPSSEYAFFRGYVGIHVFFREYRRLFRDEIVENGRFKLISFRAYVRAYILHCTFPSNSQR